MVTHAQGTRWVFTHNNYTPGSEDLIKSVLESDHVRYGVFGREVGDTGTRHLQGFVIFNSNQRFNAVRGVLPRCHIERACGTSQQARDYCKKDGDFFETGTFPESQGKRNDLDALFKWADEFQATHGRPPSEREIAVQHPKEFCKYPRLVHTIRVRAAPVELQTGELREWQTGLEEELEQPADDRKVIFYVDTEGGKGKSWFQNWYYTKYPYTTQLLGIGKRDDLCYMIQETNKTFLFNVPRGAMEFLQYNVLEQLKDRVVISGKYQSMPKFLYNRPHVVVFCNEAPDETKMSSDRFDIRNL